MLHAFQFHIICIKKSVQTKFLEQVFICKHWPSQTHRGGHVARRLWRVCCVWWQCNECWKLEHICRRLPGMDQTKDVMRWVLCSTALLYICINYSSSYSICACMVSMVFVLHYWNDFSFGNFGVILQKNAK